MYVLDMAVFKRRAYNPYMLGAATVLGFFIGGTAAQRVSPKNVHLYSPEVQETMDKDIMHAFEQNYVNLAYNAAGYGNNAISPSGLVPHGQAPAFYRKPY